MEIPPDRDDESLPELTQLDADAAPVDLATLDKLRDRSTREFQTARSTDPCDATRHVQSSPAGSRTMLTTSRLVVSLILALMAGIAVFLGGLGDTQAAVTFGDVLKHVSSADTLKLQVVQGEQKSEVLVRMPGQVRWQDSPTQYRIASGSRLWRIDEDTNSVKAGASPWFRDAQTPVDLLALLGVHEIDAAASARFSKSISVGKVQHNGRACRVFRMRIANGDRPLTIEAFADVKTNELYTIAVWPDGPRNDGPPLAELRLLARNVPVDESQFVVGKTLSDDGRVGKIVDAQGMVSLRPVMRRRWTPVCRQLLVKPGDWVRTDIRGANAVKVTLTSQVSLTLGPGTLVELLTPFRARVHYGVAQVVIPSDFDRDTFDLLGANKQVVKLEPAATEDGSPDRRLFEVDREHKLVLRKDYPQWLAGFEGATSNESLGSLIAKVDGRNVPLTVGYHKVKVEIRDQIARTTIEESFVNRTRSRLEGVFHFPLPQDASISGFGMWINGELIEADVVEKQRAREIYETILRERRDPGLLEWTGGNIFKARVFPIEPRSEKRIKIVYTQVLPVRGNEYRYSYGLRSELLRKTPLRELSIEVFVHSNLPLKSVRCGTHSVRSDMTEHSAHVEFSAQEYSPERDFEVVCEIDAQQSDVVMIPHRRGDDGYFLIQLTPPSPEGNFQRDVLPDGEPLNLLLVCDTSASMDAPSRQKQTDFVTAMLTSLGPNDRFNVAVSDVDTRWLFEESTASTDETIAQVHKTLDERISLGWTDLDKAFESILEVVEPGAHVVYIGDGIVTARDADPQTFVNRLGLLMAEGRVLRAEGKADDDASVPQPLTLSPQASFHAVSVSSSFESVVLQAIAGVSRGSVRSINGERTAQEIALELLNEMAQPGLTDVQVQFRGLQVAAVYPEKLPNVAAGTQQILIGRYLPQGEDQSGQIVVTGKRGGEEVKHAARVSLKDAEKGNSFIPRLWARMHLDQLLQQGSSQRIKDEIIGMSEEFHIITPYTSLLVLETDADRERFGVKRRFLMRDGERFFADGRDNANYELLQQQMRRAGDWRLGLRRQVLIQLAGLGRSHQAIQQLQQSQQRSGHVYGYQVNSEGRSSGFAGGFGRETASSPMAVTGGIPLFLGGELKGDLNSPSAVDRLDSLHAFDAQMPMPGELLSRALSKEGSDGAHPSLLADRDGLEMDYEVDALFERNLSLGGSFDGEFDKRKSNRGNLAAAAEKVFGVFGPVPSRGGQVGNKLAKFDISSNTYGDRRYGGGGGGFGGRAPQPGYTGWVDQLFPALGTPVELTEPIPSNWTEEALAISQSLLRTESLRKLGNGLEIRITRRVRDARWDRVTHRAEELELYSPQRWLKRPTHAGTHTIVNWCDAAERGVFSLMFNLGRARKSVKTDHENVVVGINDYSQRPLHETFRNHRVLVVESEQGRPSLVIMNPTDTQAVTRITVDAERKVVLEVASLREGKVQSKIVYSDFVRVAGRWWARRVTTTDSKEREIAVATQTIKLVDTDAFRQRFAAELAPREKVQFVELPFVNVPDSETAEKDGSAGFEHRLALLLRASVIQKWDEAIKQLEELEKLAVDGSGIRFIRAAVLVAARRNEDVRQFLLSEADRLAVGPSQDDYRLAESILGHAWSILDANEMLALLDRLKPVHERQPEHLLGLRGWKQHVTRALRNLGRTEDYVKLQRDLAESGEWDLAAQVRYTNDLAIVGEFDAAYAWFDRQIALNVERHNSEYDRLFTAYYDLLNREGRYAELVPLTARWMKTRPDSSDACQRHLGALVYADRTDNADAKCLEWLVAGRDANKLGDATRQQLFAAVQYATGYVYGSHYHVMDPKWLKPLNETARFFVRHEHNFDVAQSIIGNHLFSDSHEADGLRNWLFGILLEEAGTLEQSRRHSLVQWCLNGPTPEVTDAGWKTIADALLARWEDIEEFDVRSPLGDTLLSIYSRRFTDQQMPFLRTRIKRAPTDSRAGLRLRLFNLILQQTWQDELEVEAFTLLPLVSLDENIDVRFAALVEALHRLVDRMLVTRQEAAKSALQDKEHPEELTRHELAQKYHDFLVAAREGVAARLATETKRLRAVEAPADADKDKSGSHVNSSLADWLQIERMTLDVQLARNLEQVTAECWAWLGDAPPVVGKAGDEEEADVGAEDDGVQDALEFPLFDAALRQRAFAIVSNLAARKSATAESRKRLIDYVQIGVDRDDDGSSAWKAIKYQMLVALDDPEQLERDLREWIRTDEYATPWRRSLAKLVAEQGEIDEAIGLYETIERDSQLSPSDYAVLSDWYLVVDRRDRYKRSKIEAFKVWQEYQINNWISQQLNPWTRTDQTLPSELDENVLFAFQALFEKSSNPGGYLYQLRQFYTACRDFRLLNMLADSVVGRTPQQVYSFLGSLRSTVLEEVRDEATADEILGQVTKLRATLEQPGRDVTAIDLRALDLLEAMIERRASEVLNQPGPHVDAAVAALQRAFERDWAAGEPRQMAELLKNLGRITQRKLADEQLREFKALYAMAEPGTDDRLWIGWYYGDSQYSSYGLRDPGLALVESAMREYEATHPDGWPTHANVVFSGYVSMLTGIGRHTTAELYINRHLENSLNESQTYWLTQRMDDVYISALSHNGQVSLGSGETLYKNLLKRLLKATDTDNPNHRYQTTQKILSTFTAAKNRFIDYKDDLRKYAFEQLPPILERQTSNYRTVVDRTAYRIKDLIDTRTALHFLITRFENYPKRLRYSWQHPWQQFGWRISDWRRLVGDSLGDLEPRLLKIVLAELRQALRTRNQRSRYMYHDNYGYFWNEKRADFARVAEEVYAEVKHSRRYVEYIAQYIYHGLASNSRAHKVHSDRAIEMMLIAHGQHLLEESGQATLCTWLHQHDRYAESIPILEPMVERRPDTMDYRCRLITACHHTQRFEQRDDLLLATNEHFRQSGRWIEHNVAQLANCTRLTGLYELAIDLYGEVIPLHQRTAPNRGVGNDTLSSYYRHLADAHSHLGHTKEAVDAASGSVISWGPRYERRAAAIQKLREVLAAANDLDAYVAYLDEQLEETGQTSPLLRKTIGVVYVKQGEYQKSIPQLKLSLELQPGDMETHKELLKAYDALEDAQGAIETVLAQLDVDRHNLALYTDLANRLSSDMKLAERAATTIVESAPGEAEHHAALAVHRESQQRWPAAIEHWKHAARLRALEPTNLLKLVEAQIKGKKHRGARKTLDDVTSRTWPSRFDNDVRRAVERLKKMLVQRP